MHIVFEQLQSFNVRPVGECVGAETNQARVRRIPRLVKAASGSVGVKTARGRYASMLWEVTVTADAANRSRGKMFSL